MLLAQPLPTNWSANSESLAHKRELIFGKKVEGFQMGGKTTGTINQRNTQKSLQQPLASQQFLRGPWFACGQPSRQATKPPNSDTRYSARQSEHMLIQVELIVSGV